MHRTPGDTSVEYSWWKRDTPKLAFLLPYPRFYTQVLPQIFYHITVPTFFTLLQIPPTQYPVLPQSLHLEVFYIERLKYISDSLRGSEEAIQFEEEEQNLRIRGFHTARMFQQENGLP